MRVGHFELFGRRAAKGSALGLSQLKALAAHMIKREYPQPTDIPFQQQVVAALEQAATRFARLAAHWIRVGYAQSNFNADNCLISGATVDYGPFGFVERWQPDWGMWIGSGTHFGFMNQPEAAFRNFKQFALSTLPLMDETARRAVNAIIANYGAQAAQELNSMWSRKLGLPLDSSMLASELWEELSQLIMPGVDWIIIWRQMGIVVTKWLEADFEHAADELIVADLRAAFYAPLDERRLALWVRDWLKLLKQVSSQTAQEVASGMNLANPKYIPREWMLKSAYTAAGEGNYAVLNELMALFEKPYDEWPDLEAKYYKRQPEEVRNQGGVAFMS